MTVEAKPLSWQVRLMLALVGILGLMLLVAARRLEPDPRGFGTHEQLGLAPCYFQKLTGHVCPMCGGTTAWAHTLRGNLPQAVGVNFAATLLCVAVVIGSTWIWIVAAWGRWLVVRPTPKLALVIATAWLVVVVLDWLRRV